MFNDKAPRANRPDSDINTVRVPQTEQFQSLLEADKRRLYAYIFAYVSDGTMADDIFQDTCLALWKDFERFEIGTNFSKWANGIAFNRVMAYRRKNKKYVLGFSDDFLDEFSQTLASLESNVVQQEQRWRFLEECSSALSDNLKSIYQDFYVSNQSAQAIADATGRSIFAIRKAVHKLRKKLFDCVDEKTGSST